MVFAPIGGKGGVSVTFVTRVLVGVSATGEVLMATGVAGMGVTVTFSSGCTHPAIMVLAITAMMKMPDTRFMGGAMPRTQINFASCGRTEIPVMTAACRAGDPLLVAYQMRSVSSTALPGMKDVSQGNVLPRANPMDFCDPRWG